MTDPRQAGPDTPQSPPATGPTPRPDTRQNPPSTGPTPHSGSRGGPAATRLILVGDSTVTDDEGWAPGFRARLVPGIACVNLAQGGRSSKSYRDEGFWAKAQAAGPGHLLIQFGHNDQPGKGAHRATDPDTTFPANLDRYVAEARAAGQFPILVTSLPRRDFDAGGRLRDTLAPWAEATRRVARRTGVPLIDLHAAGLRLCTDLGPAGCAAFSPDGRDRTHLNPAGAAVFGALVAGLARQAVPTLTDALTPGG